MDVSAMMIFALALFVTGALPGPSLAALVARVLVRGWRDVVPFIAAMWFGELVWLTLAIAGLTAIAENFHWGFIFIKYCGVAYLLYLAWQMWTAPVTIKVKDRTPKSGGPVRMFLAGLAVTFGNPKLMVFYLALLPTIIDLDRISVMDWSKLIVTMLIIFAVIDFTYVALAVRARVLLKNPKTVRITNRVSAAVMGAAAAAIATR